MKIAALHMSPRSFGGPETALEYTVYGLRSQVDVTVLGLSRKEGSDWSEHARAFVDEVVHPTKDDFDQRVAEYDALILSDLSSENGKLLNHVLDGKNLPVWTVGRHTTATTKKDLDRHERMMKNPTWSRSYVSFWEQAENLPDGDFGYERATLPYVPSEELRGLPPISQRPVDFGFVGSTDVRKGPLAFAAGLEALSRQSSQRFTAVITGRPVEHRGGPHVAAIANRLEEWGWHVTRAGESGKSKWTAVRPGTESIIWYTGEYERDDLPRVLGAIKCYVNFTSGKLTPGHLEYATIEAMDAGCMVIAPGDFQSSWHYENRPMPVVSPIPSESHVYKISSRRSGYLDETIDSPDTTYKPFGEQLCRAKASMQLVDDHMTMLTKHNRKALAQGHHPKRAASAYLKALGYGSVWS
jgi:hypothetical protein